MNFFEQEKKDFKEILRRIGQKDFSGNTGQAIKNSIYQFAQNIVFKIGSLIFTILIARILLPERFGLYTLALSTIIIFSSFSDLGIGYALLTFVSKRLGKNQYAEAKGYISQLFKWKLYLVFLSSIILGVSAYFISNYYYQKPIFYALIAGMIYIPVYSLLGFVEQIFKSNNNFKKPFIKDIIFQISRFILIPMIILLSISLDVSSQKIILGIFLGLSFCYLLSLLIMIFWSKKSISFLSIKEEKLNKDEKKGLIHFILPLSTIAFSSIFFGYIDTFMLGHYVSEGYIAYYGAAFGLIGAVATLVGFTAGGMFPIFARKEGLQLEFIFRKTRNFTFLLATLGGILTFLLSYYFVILAYGQEYLPAVNILRLFSPLIIILPLSSLYDTYYSSKEQTKVLMWLLISSTIFNIFANLFGILYGIHNYGEIGGVYGACIATILSRFIYLFGLIFFRKSNYLSNSFSKTSDN